MIGGGSGGGRTGGHLYEKSPPLVRLIDVTIAHAHRAVAVGSSGWTMHTLSLPPVSPREYKMFGWQKDRLAEQCVHPAIYKKVMETRVVGHATQALRSTPPGANSTMLICVCF